MDQLCSLGVRFVDDFFAFERKECAEVAMKCFARHACSCVLLHSLLHSGFQCAFARVVQLLLGNGAINGKTEFGNPLVLLGVQVTLAADGFRARPEETKRLKWSADIKRALQRGLLTPGEASKLAGKLTWASQSCFRKVGRAMLYAIYRCPL